MDNELDVDINLVYLHLIEKFQYSFISPPEDYCVNCQKNPERNLPIPIKLKQNKIICKNNTCSFTCLIEYLKKQKQIGNMENIYSFNIVWTILPFYLYSK